MNLDLLMPEIALAITAIVVIFVDLLTKRKGAIMLVSLLGIIVASVRAVISVGADAQVTGNGLFAFDGYSIFFLLFFLALAFVVIDNARGSGLIWWLSLFFLVDNFFVLTLQVILPLGFNDGSTILYWLRHRETKS